MKKILFLALFALVSCANDKPIEVGQLPAEAQNFLTEHFAAKKVALATMDREISGTSYEVAFTDGGKVEFDGRGRWKDVEPARGTAVPAALVPEQIRAHIAANYSGMSVREISRSRRSWEVSLTGETEPRRSVELKFDTAFKLIEIDD